ncbi:hypothetical protein JW930_02920 [Candidatus Woesearchaeota archaeon]|nr:hypothetical protein [Candidatus Woesearchaeota archaeon]
MANGHYGGHQKKQVHDHYHTPEEQLVEDIHGKRYRLKPYQQQSLKSIEEKLKSGSEFTKKELHEYQEYLDELSEKIREALTAEKADGISNIELERDLRRIGVLLNQVSAILERY